MQADNDSSGFAHSAVHVSFCPGICWHGFIKAHGRFAVKDYSRLARIQLRRRRGDEAHYFNSDLK